MARYRIGAIRAALTLGLLIAVAGCSSGENGAADGKTPVAIGYGLTSDTLPAHVAKERGFFGQHGLDASLLPASGSSGLNSGLVSGNLQIIMSNPAALLTAVNGGLDFVIVAGGPRMTKADDPIGLLVQPGLNYAGPASLIGKHVGVPSFDSAMYIILKKWLADRHVDAGKIQFVEAGMAQMGTLLQAKQVDAVVTVEPFLSRIQSDGYGRLAEKYYTEVIPDQPAIFWIATRDWAARNPKAVQAFRQSLAEGAAYIEAHPDEARAKEKAVFKSNRAALPNRDTHVTSEDLAAYYRVGKQLGLFTREIDVSKLILSGTN